MRICYINPTLLVRRPLAELVGQLGDEHEISVLLPKKLFSTHDTSWHSSEHLCKATIYSYSTISIPFIPFDWPIPITPMFFVHLARLYRTHDVVHAWTYFYISTFFAGLYKLLYRKTKLVISADTLPGYSFKPGWLFTLVFWLYTPISWLLFHLANLVHLYGNSMIAPARRAGAPRNKIRVVPTGLDVKKFATAKATPRTTLDISSSDFVLFFAGLLVPRKGIDTMLHVVAQLTQDIPSIKLVLVGEGPRKKYYIRLAEQLRISNFVRFLGWRKDIPSLLKTADVLLLPSRAEGLSGIIMEAMASKLPVVTSNIAGTTDLVRKDTGILCKPTDTAAFAKAIKRLYADAKLRRHLATAAYKQITAYDWPLLKKRYLELYQ